MMIALIVILFGSVMGSDDHFQLLRRRISTPCQYDSNCVENAYCRVEFCYCKDNYVLDRNRTHIRCLRIARGMGDPCEKDVQCQLKFGADAECLENRCDCSSLSRFVEERCYKTAGLGDLCQSNRNCYVEGSRSFCVTGRCVCPLLQHASSDRTRCVKSIFLQEECTRDEECVVENSRCFGNCTCDISHVMSADKKECLKKADEVGEPCQEDSQCQDPLKSAKCQDGKCSCNKGYHRRSGACFCSIGLNQSCENHHQCTTPTNMDSNTSSVTNVDCINGVCTCAEHHTFTSDGLDCIGYAENGVSSWRLSSSIALIIASFIAVN
ncbi:tenascin-like isoform X2 [Belonocnema kinseyi]|uniref:tenascin-like isoform X2 n=1 Tax=Belonocnema kinseyi TaxID=2817044 RepID=UPI00143D7B7B|nr:tenascin-like isoform X2 [Belonocnema kinseyi]